MKTPLQQVFILVAFAVASAFGQTVTWTGAIDPEFSNSGNWSGGFPASTSDVIFDTSTRTTVDINGAQMVGSFTFNAGSPSYTFSGTNSGRISLGLGGLTVAGTAAGVVFDTTVGVDLMANQTWTVGADTIVRGVLSGNAGTFTKTGSKTLRLEGANTFAGNTTIATGKLLVTNATGSGTGTGTVTIDAGATLQIGNHNLMGAVSGPIVNNGSLVFDRTDLLTRISTGILASYKHESVISGTGSVTINQGVVALTGANTYTGDTTVLSGRVIALNSTGSATGTGNVILAGPNALLEIGRDTAYGSISGNIHMNVPAWGVLFVRSDDVRYDGIMSGLGSVQVGGAGITTWGGLNTYQGQTYVQNGTLADATAGVFSPNSKILVATDAALAVNFNETIPALMSSGVKFSLAPELALGRIEIAAGATLTLSTPSGTDEIFNGVISGAGALAKAGPGTQRLGGASTYTGGTNHTGGTLLVTKSTIRDANNLLTSGPLGTGLVKLGDGVFFGLGAGSARIDNALNIGTNVTLLGGKEDDAFLELGGAIAFTNANTLLHARGDTSIILWGGLSGPANSALTIDGGGAVVLLGATDASLTSMTADAGGISFEHTAALPSTLSVNAINGGYVSVAASGEPATSPTPTQLLARIASPASFQGTFGVDTDPSLPRVHTFTDNLDFSAFTNTSFRIGSGTAAILAGTITPPVVNGAPLYAFGGVRGHLGITSALTNVGGAPAAVTVSSATGFDPMTVIFRGANTYTGSLTTGTATANLVVDNGMAVLDSPGALPAGATFAFGASGPGYVSATDAAGFASFADFASRVAAGGYGANSILGIDSHAFFDFKIANGPDAKPGPLGTFGGTVDLRSFSSIYLGTSTDMLLTGPILAPADGVLRLTAVDDGHLTIATLLGSGINSVVIGVAGSGSEEFAEGAVRFTANNTYAGGTTLLSGTLELDGRATNSGSDSPLGTGPLTVVSGGVSTPVVRGPNGTSGGTTVPVVLNDTLQVNDRTPGNSDPLGSTAPVFTFNGPVSGPGSLEVFGKVYFNSIVPSHTANTYSGGTVLHAGSVAAFGFNGALGTGPLTIDGPSVIFSYSGGDLILTNPLVLRGELQHAANGALKISGPITLQGDASLKYKWGQNDRPNQLSGAISGPGMLTLAPQWLPVIYELSGTNTYSGGTIAAGAIVKFMNESAVPTVGLLQATLPSGFSDAGYIGAAFTTNTRAFLDRFDKERTFGTIGFDSADAANPNVFTSDIDLAGFNPYVWLGSASAAILSGTITPQGDVYVFGDGGGTLTITSNLTGNRSVIADSSTRPLQLVLKGTNSHTGTTEAYNSVIRLASAGALPASSTLMAQNGYIGMTEAVGLSLSSFIQRFSSAVNSVIGLDADDPVAGRVINDPISFVPYSTLSTAYLGTATKLTLNGALTPYATDLRLAAVGTGSLIVNSVIGSGSVTIGTPGSISANATVTLNGANTYTGGTTLNGTHLLLGHASALGTGTLTVAGSGSLGASVAGLTIANPIISGSAGLVIDGTNSFTLAGPLTLAQLRKTGPGALTLAGSNPSLSGYVAIDAGSLIVGQNDALGTSSLQLAESTLADFRTAAPVITSLYGGGVSTGSSGLPSEVRLADNSILTIIGESAYSGAITGNAGVVIANHAVNTYGGAALYGNNTYTGGTTIQSGAALKVGGDNALGAAGNVTLNGGTLAIYARTNLRFSTASNHALVFNSGRILGAGTITSDASLILGAGKTLAGGTPVYGGSASVGDVIVPATLSLSFSGSSKLVFDSGGSCEVRIADATVANGWSQIALTGTLDITATAAAPFQLTLASINYTSGTPGFGLAQSFNPGMPYTWTWLTATSITGFDAAKFSVNASDFLNMSIDAGFTVGVNDLASPTSLLIHYNPAAVPEPSTWALLLAGVAVLGVAGFRRRR